MYDIYVDDDYRLAAYFFNSSLTLTLSRLHHQAYLCQSSSTHRLSRTTGSLIPNLRWNIAQLIGIYLLRALYRQTC